MQSRHFKKRSFTATKKPVKTGNGRRTAVTFNNRKWIRTKPTQPTQQQIIAMPVDNEESSSDNGMVSVSFQSHNRKLCLHKPINDCYFNTLSKQYSS